jgi:hypothetical protein
VKPSVLYRTAAALLILFAVGHTAGFRESDPTWGVEPALASLRSTHFTIQGFTRTYWDFFLGSGFTVGVLYVLAAVLAWQLGGLPKETLAGMRAIAWGLPSAFGLIMLLSWQYLFWIPIGMSGAITVCLTAAAWSSRKGAMASADDQTASRRGA